MDPLSIIVSVGALSKATWSVTKFLVRFVQNTGNISQPCKDLVAQMESMSNALSNLQSVLDDPMIIDAETFAAEKSENEWETSKLWSSVHRSVLACREVLSRLQKSITGFTSDPSRIPQKMWLQVRLNLKEPEMRNIKEQVSFHFKVLQSSVQTLSLRAIYLIPGRVNADILPRIAGVEEMIKELRKFLSTDKKGRSGDNGNRIAQTGMDVAQDTIESALEVMSSAKTAYAQSESSSSVLGEPLDPSKAASIALWVPEPTNEHGLPRSFLLPPYNSARPEVSRGSSGSGAPVRAMSSSTLDTPIDNSLHHLEPRRVETFTSNGETIANSRIDDIESSADAHSDVVSRDSSAMGFGHPHQPPSRSSALTPGTARSTADTMHSDDDDTGADSDLECEMHEAEYFFEKGAALMEKGRYKEAMECLKGGMEPASKLGFKLKQKIRFYEHKLLLATCLYQVGDLQAAEKYLYELSGASLSKLAKSSDGEGLQLCQVCFLLAVIYLRRAEENQGHHEFVQEGPSQQSKSQSYLTAANSYCRQAMKGRWRILGRSSDSYFESVYLLSLIERASGNSTRADGHYEMIPAEKRSIVVNNLSRLLGTSEKLRQFVQHLPPNKELPPDPRGSQMDMAAQPPPYSGKPASKPALPIYSSSSTTPLTSPQSSTSPSPFTKFDFPKPVFTAAEIPKDAFQFNLPKSEHPPPPPVPETSLRPHSHKGSTTTTTMSTFGLDSFDLLVLQGFMEFLPRTPGQPGSPTELNSLPPPELLVSWLHRFDIKQKPFAGPIHIAAAVGHAEAVNMFLAEGTDATLPTFNDHTSTIPKVMHNRGATPLHFAATYDQADVAKMLLRGNTIRLLEVQDKEKKTALHYAARAGSYNVLVLLLERKADVSAKDVSGNTPLILAAMYGHLDCLQLLHYSGANVHAATNEKCTSLHFAAASGHTQCVEFLLSKNVDPDAKSGYGQTPLVRAAETGNEDVVKLLLAKGVDVNMQDHRARTPLHGAATFNKVEIARLLIENGAKTSYCDLHGKSALALAKFNKYEEMIALLQNPPKLSKEDKERLKREKKDMERERKNLERERKDQEKDKTRKDSAKESTKESIKESAVTTPTSPPAAPVKEVKSASGSKGLFSFRKKNKMDKNEVVHTITETV